MVDVSDKAVTSRLAIATGRVQMSAKTLQIAKSRDTKKGDPIAIAELAGIMASKKTADIIPLCHPLPLTNVKVSISAASTTEFEVTASAKTTGQTGVEMEALTAVSAACLTLYDMLKAVDKDMVISEICLRQKTGGKSGAYKRTAK
ncbi:UNVERIFIED_CONTAM: hypothetical protein GTU68_045098 [Idotea baltica]|nr:hypothetical protein [Idotea baltica]